MPKSDCPQKRKSRKAKQRRGLLHQGLDRHRLKNPECSKLERAFADAWEDKNKPGPLDFGHGILQDLMFRNRPGEIVDRHFKRVPFWITQREAVIVATIIQWLGTNCGFGFLRTVLQKCDYAIEDVSEQELERKKAFGAMEAKAEKYKRKKRDLRISGWLDLEASDADKNMLNLWKERKGVC